MDESLRGFDERARIFFTQLASDIDKKSPPKKVLKKRFINEARHVLRLSSAQTNELRRSFNIAFWAYEKLVRRSGEAYVFHPMRGTLVMTWILGMYHVRDVNLLHTSLLHDSYEETDDTWFAQLVIRLVVRFFSGGGVATDVLHLTKNEEESDESYFFRLITCGRWRVLMAKFVDRIDNLWTLDGRDTERSSRKIRETEMWFPRLEHELTSLIMKEIKEGRLGEEWLKVISFIVEYLWYAVASKKREFGMV